MKIEQLNTDIYPSNMDVIYHIYLKDDKICKAQRSLVSKLGSEATSNDLSKELGMPDEKIEKYLMISNKTISMDLTIGEDGDTTIGDMLVDTSGVSPEDAAIQSELCNDCKDALSMLKPKERLVLEKRFGFYNGTVETLEDIGVELGVKRERIRQIEAKAINKLKNSTSVIRKLEGYLEYAA